MDDAFWGAAPWTEKFVDIEGEVRPAPPLRTCAKMMWDDKFLYVAAAMEEPHVWGTLTERDSIVYHDNDFEVFLNPTGDSHHYYELEINALGTIFDLFLPRPYRDGGPADHGWDVAGLVSAVHFEGTLNDPSDTDRGWTVELAFPWAAFDRHGRSGGPPRDGEQWRVNFSRVQWDLDVVDGKYRKVAGRSEHNWVWSPQGIIDMHRPEQWGYVQFSDIVAGRGEAAFVPDESEAVRDELHRIYYAQKAFHHARGRWAALAELAGLESIGCEVTAAGEGWIARKSLRGRDGAAQMWAIRQDSRIFREF